MDDVADARDAAAYEAALWRELRGDSLSRAFVLREERRSGAGTWWKARVRECGWCAPSYAFAFAEEVRARSVGPDACGIRAEKGAPGP